MTDGARAQGGIDLGDVRFRTIFGGSIERGIGGLASISGAVWVSHVAGGATAVGWFVGAWLRQTTHQFAIAAFAARLGAGIAEFSLLVLGIKTLAGECFSLVCGRLSKATTLPTFTIGICATAIGVDLAEVGDVVEIVDGHDLELQIASAGTDGAGDGDIQPGLVGVLFDLQRFACQKKADLFDAHLIHDQSLKLLVAIQTLFVDGLDDLDLGSRLVHHHL